MIFTPRSAPSNTPPLINLPPMVKALTFTLCLVFGLQWILPESDAFTLIERYAFIPARYTGGEFSLYEAVVSPLTFLFLHGSLLHLAINVVMLMAFGTAIERTLGSSRMLAYYAICGLASAAVHMAFHPYSVIPVIGASGAISGLFGGIVYTMGRHYGNVLIVVLVWLIFNAITGLFFQLDAGSGIAWEAHMGGFLAGFFLFPLFVSRKIR